VVYLYVKFGEDRSSIKDLMFVFHCTHVRMSYVLNSYLLTYLLTYLQLWHVYYYYYYRKKRFRWRNVKRLQGHLTKRECDAKWEQSICQMRSWAELSRSGKLRLNSSVFNWRLKDASEGNDVRDLDRLFDVRAAATGKARSPAVERRVGGTTSVDVYCT